MKKQNIYRIWVRAASIFSIGGPAVAQTARGIFSLQQLHSLFFKEYDQHPVNADTSICQFDEKHAFGKYP